MSSTNGIHDSVPCITPLRILIPWPISEREGDNDIDLSWHLDYHIKYASAVVCSLHDPTPEVITSAHSNFMIQKITQNQIMVSQGMRAIMTWRVWFKATNPNPIGYRPSGKFGYTQYPNLKKYNQMSISKYNVNLFIHQIPTYFIGKKIIII